MDFLIHSRDVWYQCGQSIDYDVVLARLPEIERLDADALDRKIDLVTVNVELEVELLQQGLVTNGPADVSAERQANASGFGRHILFVLIQRLVPL